MASAYPAITKEEFSEAGKVLQGAYTTSHQVGDWIDFECTSSEISIRQRRDPSYASSTLKSLVIADDEFEVGEEFEQEDKVIFMFLQIIHFSRVNF